MMRPAVLFWMSLGLIVGGSLFPLRSSADEQLSNAEQVAQLIQQLGNSTFHERETATKELVAIGQPAFGALRKAAASNPDPEIRHRARRIIRTVTVHLAGAEQKRMEGTWVGVAEEQNGQATPSQTKVMLKAGQSIATNAAGVEVFRCIWSIIDPTAAPRQLDLVAPDGRVFQAIYEFDGAKFRYCGSYTKRPDTFTTSPADGRYMATLKRAELGNASATQE